MRLLNTLTHSQLVYSYRCIFNVISHHSLSNWIGLSSVLRPLQHSIGSLRALIESLGVSLKVKSKDLWHWP